MEAGFEGQPASTSAYVPIAMGRAGVRPSACGAVHVRARQNRHGEAQVSFGTR